MDYNISWHRKIYWLQLFFKALLFRSENLKPVIVLSCPRTGSTLLSSYLGSLEKIEIQGEILNPNIYPFFEFLAKTPFSRQIALLKLKLSAAKNSSKIQSYKLTFGHLNRLKLSLEDLQKTFPSARFIAIYRHSLLDSYISLIRAKKRQEWFTTKSNSNFNENKFLVKKNEFLEFCHKTKTNYKTCNLVDLTDRILILEYQELCDAPQAIFKEKICPFLGVKYKPVQTSLKKQITCSAMDLIANSDEIREILNDRIEFLEFNPDRGGFY